MIQYYRPSAVLLARIISAVLFVPLRFGSLFMGRKQAGPPKRILIQDGYRLGDLIMLSTSADLLRRSFPQAEIHLITLPAGCDMLRDAGWFDRVIGYRAPWAFWPGPMHTLRDFVQGVRMVKNGRYDLAVDFQGDPRGVAMLYLAGIPRRVSFREFGAASFCTRSPAVPAGVVHQMRRVEFLAEQVTGKRCQRSMKPIWPRQINLEQNKRFGPRGKGRKLVRPAILLHVGASNRKRYWGTERFARLIELLRENACRPVLVAGPDERKIISNVQINLAVPCESRLPSFNELEELIGDAAVVVCHDSFMMHAAWALNKNALVLCGPSNPRYFAPVGKHTRVVWNDTLIRPPYTAWTGPVPMSATSPDTVLRAILATLGRESR
jgi:heptosyltransferase-2